MFVHDHMATMSDTSGPARQDITSQAVRALTLYSLAEFQSGHATTLHVMASGTAFSVADDGRGHAVGRTVAGAPYLQFIYTQLDYPFGLATGGPVQLHGIGMSLLNALCSQLSVTVHKPEGTLRLTYRAGRLYNEERLEPAIPSTGNIVAGNIKPDLQPENTNADLIGQWLGGVLSANPGLKLHFNGRQLHAPAQSAD